MTNTMTQVAQQLLIPPMLWFFFFSGIVGIAVGLGLIFSSARTFTLFEKMNQWMSFRRIAKPAAIQRDSWPFVERHRRWLALVLAIASLFTIVSLVNDSNMFRLVGTWSNSPLMTGWIVNCIWWFLLLGSALVIVVSMLLGFFPQAILKLEKQSGRWYSTRHFSRNADTMHTPLDQLAHGCPRGLGVAIALISLANVIAIAWRLF